MFCGGAGFFAGPMVGSIVYTFLQAFVTGFTVYWPMTIGIIILFIVLFSPGGLFGFIDEAVRNASTRRARAMDEGDQSAIIGAGKTTTTIKTIMGLVRASGGSITFDGESLIGLQHHKIAHKGLGYVPDERLISRYAKTSRSPLLGMIPSLVDGDSFHRDHLSAG